jgi:CheY-like chemotaxis protein
MVVLFVDPSTEVRNRRTRALAESGLTVYEADGAEAAVGVAQQLKMLDVLVTEGVLDGEFTGFDLRDAIRQKFPALRAVFTSRYELTGLEAMVQSESVFYEPVDEGVLLKQVIDGHAGEAARSTVESPVAPTPVEPAAAPPSQPAAQEPASAESPPPVELSVPEAAIAPEVSGEPLPEEAATETALPLAAEAVAEPPAAAVPAAETPHEENDPPLLKTGTHLGNYVIKEMLYSERDTQTYLALQTAVQREVALVLLKPEYLADTEAVDRFHERSRLKASITHPRIAPLYEAIETGGWIFYTREMPHGRSLDDLILSGAK